MKIVKNQAPLTQPVIGEEKKEASAGRLRIIPAPPLDRSRWSYGSPVPSDASPPPGLSAEEFQEIVKNISPKGPTKFDRSSRFESLSLSEPNSSPRVEAVAAKKMKKKVSWSDESDSPTGLCEVRTFETPLRSLHDAALDRVRANLPYLHQNDEDDIFLLGELKKLAKLPLDCSYTHEDVRKSISFILGHTSIDVQDFFFSRNIKPGTLDEYDSHMDFIYRTVKAYTNSKKEVQSCLPFDFCGIRI